LEVIEEEREEAPRIIILLCTYDNKWED